MSFREQSGQGLARWCTGRPLAVSAVSSFVPEIAAELAEVAHAGPIPLSYRNRVPFGRRAPVSRAFEVQDFGLGKVGDLAAQPATSSGISTITSAGARIPRWIRRVSIPLCQRSSGGEEEIRQGDAQRD
jgi:hypothetical protein